MSDDLDAVVRELQALRRDHNKLRTQYDATFVQGPVLERDHEKGVRVGRDPKGEFRSGWTQTADFSGRSRVLPDKGENVLMLHPHGDTRQGVVIGLGHSDDKKNPAKDADNTVLLNYNGVRIEGDKDKATITAKTIVLTTGDATITLEGGNVTIKGKLKVEGDTAISDGKLTHEGKDVGATHTHTSVTRGGATSGAPV